jgi:hypothetical protein
MRGTLLLRVSPSRADGTASYAKGEDSQVHPLRDFHPMGDGVEVPDSK